MNNIVNSNVHGNTNESQNRVDEMYPSSQVECKLRIESNNIQSIKKVIQLLKNESKMYNISISNEVSIPLKKKVFTVLRSPHIDKKSREQFEIRTYSQFIHINKIESSKLNTYLTVIKDLITEDVSVKVKFTSFENI